MSRSFPVLPLRAPLFAAVSLALPALLATTTVHAVAGPHAHTRADTLDRVVVTARAPSTALTWQTDPRQPRQPVPASDGADYLKTVPGFATIRNGGTNGDAVLRGMFGSRLGILSNDGVMVGACPSRMDNPLSYLSPETFDALTVIKGPQSVQWGPGNSAGTVRFERDVPRFDAPGSRLNASALAGSNNRNDQVLDATLGNRNGYLRVGGNRSEADDYRDGNGQRVPGAWNKWNAEAAIGWTPDADTVIELNAGRGDARARYAGRGMDGSAFERDSLGLRLERNNLPGAWESLQANAYVNRADHVMDNYSLREPNPASSMPMAMGSNPDRRTAGGRLAASWQFNAVELVAGIDHQDSQHRGRSAMGIDAWRNQPRVRDAVLRNSGVFAELTAGAGSDSRWISGLRIDRASARDLRSSLSGGHGGMARPNPTQGLTRNEQLGSGFLRHERQTSARLNWYAGIGHASRMPDYWELFSPKMGPAGSANAFAAIAPERTTQLDIGLHWRAEQLQGWISAYAGQVDDYIRFDYSNHGMSRAQNIDARIAGAEAGLEWQPRAGLNLGSSLAYAWGEQRDDGRPLAQMPPLEARLSADWQGQRFNAGGLLRLAAAQNRSNPGMGNVTSRDLGPSAGFAVFSLNAGVRLSDHLQLSAGIDNLFDRAYAEHLNLAGSADFGWPADPVRINEPGRNLWLKLDFKH
ncbi:MAG: TonB-dependent copper receptor [Stenotrophomonas sp.]